MVLYLIVSDHDVTNDKEVRRSENKSENYSIVVGSEVLAFILKDQCFEPSPQAVWKQTLTGVMLV